MYLVIKLTKIYAFGTIKNPSKTIRTQKTHYYFILKNSKKTINYDDAEKSLVSHTVLARSKQYLHNKKRRPNREHRSGAGQIPSEGQIRISHNFRVPELE